MRKPSWRLSQFYNGCSPFEAAQQHNGADVMHIELPDLHRFRLVALVSYLLSVSLHTAHRERYVQMTKH